MMHCKILYNTEYLINTDLYFILGKEIDKTSF